MTKKAKSVLFWGCLILGLAVAFHLATVVLYPRAWMFYVARKVSDKDGVNVLVHRKRPTPQDRVVVAPCPDLVYSIAAYDVSSAPIRITAPKTGDYMSLSLYAANSDNFFVMNDRQVENGRMDVVLIGPRTPEPSVSGAKVVRSPTRTGIVLFRFFAGDGKSADEIHRLQLQCACTVLAVK
jgi:uncharacterized membrane protein